MSKKKKIIFFLLIFITANCSFDSFTGIWGDPNKEKKRAKEIELRQQSVLDVIEIYSTSDENTYNKEINLKKIIKLTPPDKNSSWKMSGLNLQNFLGNIYLPSIDNRFLKKKNRKKQTTNIKNKNVTIGF